MCLHQIFVHIKISKNNRIIKTYYFYFLIDLRNIHQNITYSIPSAETFGKINMPQQYNQNINTQRISGDLLEAFKSNPFTQSLQSF